MVILSIHQMHLTRGAHLICQNLDLTVGQGDLITVTGPNGAGKTSLLRALSGLLTPVTGTCRWHIGAAEDGEINRQAQTLYIAHMPALRSELTVGENIQFYARLRDPQQVLSQQNMMDKLAYFKMDLFVDMLCGKLSQGQRRRVALTRLLTERTMLWLLDEPDASVDDEGRDCLNKLLERHLADGGAAVIATHRPLIPEWRPSHCLQLPC